MLLLGRSRLLVSFIGLAQFRVMVRELLDDVFPHFRGFYTISVLDAFGDAVCCLLVGTRTPD